MSTAAPVSSPVPPSPSSPLPRAKVQVLAGWKRLLAAAAGLVLRVWTATLHIRTSEATLRLVSDTSGPALFVLWHNRVFVGPALSRRFRAHRRLHCLVSASKDGAWVSAFLANIGLAAVRGSSSKGGREAAVELVRVLREGHDVGLTPDGPRGPLYTCKPGALVVARRAGVPVIVLGIAYQSAWRLRSWDRFLLPRPFSQIRLIAHEIPTDTLDADDALARLAETLRAYNPDT